MDRAPNAWDRFYHRHDAPWRGERMVQDLLPRLGPGPVLELGCGNGKLLRPLQAAGVDVVGLDISFNVLRRLGHGVLADAATLPFADGAFTAVLDVHCTGHLLADGRARAAAEKRRVLRDDGWLLVERLTPADLRASQGTEVEADTRGLEDGRTTHFSDADDIAREHAGFVLVEHATETRTPRFGRQHVTRSSCRAWLR